MAIDRNARQLAQEQACSGVQLLQADKVAETAKSEIRLAVSVVAAPYVPVERSLAEVDFKDIVPFYDLAESFRHVHPLSNGWFAPPVSLADRENTESALRFDYDHTIEHKLMISASPDGFLKRV